MRVIVAGLINVALMFTISLANATGGYSQLPNANNLFQNTNNLFLNAIDNGMGGGLNAILLLLYKIGFTISVIFLILIAMRLILASPAKKAEIKAGLAPYFIGLLLLIAGVPIAIKVIEIFTTLF